MNILLLTYQGDIAGSTYSISYLAKGLAERGHTVVVGCRKEALLYSLLEDTKVALVPMQFRSKLDGKNMAHIKEIVEEYSIQVINAQSSKDRYTSSLAVWRYKLPVVVVHTRRQHPMSSGGKLQSIFYEWATDKIVAVSQGVKNGLVGLGISAKNIEVIKNGTPAEKYELPGKAERAKEIRKELDITANQRVIGCISRKKQQEQLLEALSFIEQPLTVVLIGVEKSPHFDSVAEKVPKQHTVHFLGSIPPKEAIYYYTVFDLKVLPSTIEGLSQSLLEAMAFGVPVIATNASGNPDLIEAGRNGLLFEEGNSRELARKIESVLSDEKLYKKLAENGKKSAYGEFSINRVITEYESFFERLLKNKKLI